MRHVSASVLALFLASWAAAQDKPPVKPEDAMKARHAARDKGLEWLTKNQAKDGSWGKQYTLAVTSFACLGYLSASEEPFTGDNGKALVKASGTAGQKVAVHSYGASGVKDAVRAGASASHTAGRTARLV